MSASGSSANATRRWGEIARLIEVRGASKGEGGRVPFSSRLRPLRVRAVVTVRVTVRATASTWLGSAPITWRHRSSSPGSGGGDQVGSAERTGLPNAAPEGAVAPPD